MIIINPTDSKIVVTIGGEEYTLPANGKLSGVRSEHALYWKQRIHQFINIEDESTVKVETSAPKVAVQETPVVDEAPKKVTKK